MAYFIYVVFYSLLLVFLVGTRPAVQQFLKERDRVAAIIVGLLLTLMTNVLFVMAVDYYSSEVEDSSIASLEPLHFGSTLTRSVTDVPLPDTVVISVAPEEAIATSCGYYLDSLTIMAATNQQLQRATQGLEQERQSLRGKVQALTSYQEEYYEEAINTLFEETTRLQQKNKALAQTLKEVVGERDELRTLVRHQETSPAISRLHDNQ